MLFAEPHALSLHPESGILIFSSAHLLELLLGERDSQTSDPDHQAAEEEQDKVHPPEGRVEAVHLSHAHNFSKQSRDHITLVVGHGVESDSHSGPTVQHRSRLHIRPVPPNLRQVHLMPRELFAAVRDGEWAVRPGDLGENITTAGLELVRLGEGTRLRFVAAGGEAEGETPTVRVTGLRNPCPQIDKFSAGLKERLIVRDEDRKIVGRLAGVMSVVEVGGDIRPGMKIVVEEPEVWKELECV